MQIHLRIIFTLVMACGFTSLARGKDYEPELFQTMQLIYEDSFDTDGPHKLKKQWVIRQNTQWHVKNGVLTGGLADAEYQKMMQEKKDGHDGTRTVIFLKPVPKAFVLRMRVRYNETDRKGRDRGSLLDLGHHVNSFVFRGNEGVLTLQKKKKIRLPNGFFPLNQWNDVTVEIKEGALLICVNETTLHFKDPLITLKSENDFQQIDFKGQDLGTVQIDWLRLYRGSE